MTFTYRDGVAVGEIGFYFPTLLIAVYLAIRHGFWLSEGWFFLILFSIARIVGPIFELLLISHRSHQLSVDLITAAAILQSVGLSLLLLAALGLLRRVITSISKHHRTFRKRRFMSIGVIYVIVLVGVGLGIYGGTDSSKDIKHGRYVPQTWSKIGQGLIIGGYVLIFLTTFLTTINVKHADPGEKRFLFAVALSLFPFFLVRIFYSAISTFYIHSRIFNLVYGNCTVWLVMAIIMEIIIVLIFVIFGLTYRKVPKYERPITSPSPPGSRPGQQTLSKYERPKAAAGSPSPGHQTVNVIVAPYQGN